MVNRPFVCTGGLPTLKHRIGCTCPAPESYPTRLSLQSNWENYSSTTCICADQKVTHLPQLHGGYNKYFVHGSCVHNVVNALYGRVGSCVPSPSAHGLSLLKEMALHLSNLIGTVTPSKYEAVIASYSGGKRRRYQEAFRNIQLGKQPTGKIKMFVKAELIKYNGEKRNPECRAIQFRDYEYALELARYVKPFEHKLYIACGGRFPPMPVITKGMDSAVKAALLMEKVKRLGGDIWYLALDAERFDAHVSDKLLGVEHGVMSRCFGFSKRLQKLLKKQINNKGTARCKNGAKVKYTIRGGRNSGDMNTASGNNLLMMTMLNVFGTTYFERGNYDFVLDGDDSVFIHKGQQLPEQEIEDFFRNFGMTIKIDRYTRDLNDVDFCQAKVVKVEGFHKFVRNFRTVLPKTLTNPKFANKNIRPKLLKTIALGELSQCYGVPVLDPFFRKMIDVADSVMSNRGKRDGGLLKPGQYLPWRLLNVLPKDWKTIRGSTIAHETRKHFSEVFDISVRSQLQLEKRIADIRINLLEQAVERPGIDVKNWLYDWMPLEIVP